MKRIFGRLAFGVSIGCSALLVGTDRPEAARRSFLQPAVGVPVVMANANGTVDVVVEVATVTEDVRVDASDPAKTKKLTSGVYDLRLFRDGQLIGTSTPREKTELYIRDAPAAVAKDKAAYAIDPKNAVFNTNEDKLWRANNDVFSAASPSIKILPPTKPGEAPIRAEVTFKNIKLPRDGRTEVEFSAYAFNIDRVKSETVRTTFKIEKPEKIKGRAFLISIGVNSSENKSFDLKYAANDARKMQEVIGDRLNDDGTRFSEVIKVPIVSDYKTDKFAEVNDARKALIKGVFAMLAGTSLKDAAAEIAKSDKALADAFVANIAFQKIKPVEPEDTVIITYAGHGYADQSGIFYLLPNDIGTDTSKLTTEGIDRMISSDEISLWMLPITGVEMIMVIDACHSASAVQGDNFKPGPMGSRGLGQLSYDKAMKILSATQSDNVALELGNLQQGLLSYVLLEDGVIGKKADTGSAPDGKLTPSEWLKYAEAAVPKLYQDVLDGKRSIMIGGREVDVSKIPPGERGAKLFGETGNRETMVQKPNVFDFRKKKDESPMITLK
jgi:hypothetical protein